MKKQHIAFMTSCRSDFAKLRPYINFFVKRKIYVSIFVTSMHVNKVLGCTRKHLETYFPKYVHFCWDDSFPQHEPVVGMTHLLKAINDFFIRKHITFLFVHGDRMEALAATIAATLRQIPVCHIEAGDESGNIDESFRHAITKLANRFLVDNDIAKRRVIQMGEDPCSVFTVGFSVLCLLPTEKEQKRLLENLQINSPYIVVLYHPETGLTPKQQYQRCKEMVSTLGKLPFQYIVLPPNNDPGYTEILRAYQSFPQKKVKFIKSLSCEDYLSLLSSSIGLVGNSSSGVKEAPLLQVPSITFGSRQNNRVNGFNFTTCYFVQSAKELQACIQNNFLKSVKYKQHLLTTQKFEQQLERIFAPAFFTPNLQKCFYNSLCKRRSKARSHRSKS